MEYFALTSTLTGSRRHARCNFATLFVIVALNNCVRRSLGITRNILSISSSKSKFNNLSASSSTSTLSARKLNPFVFSK